MARKSTAEAFAKIDRKIVRAMSKWNPIARVSQRQKGRLAEYAKVKRKFLKEHNRCELCHFKSTDVHHKRGRVSSLLCDTRFFMAVCRPCHNLIHTKPAWAREMGYIEKWGSIRDDPRD